MAELSSKLKALKFMQRKETASNTEHVPVAITTLEENRAKLAANVRWSLETPSTIQPLPKSFKVVYEQSGGQNRTSHLIFNDFNKTKDDNKDNEPMVVEEHSSDNKHPKYLPKSSPPSSSNRKNSQTNINKVEQSENEHHTVLKSQVFAPIVKNKANYNNQKNYNNIDGNSKKLNSPKKSSINKNFSTAKSQKDKDDDYYSSRRRN